MQEILRKASKDKRDIQRRRGGEKIVCGTDLMKSHIQRRFVKNNERLSRIPLYGYLRLFGRSHSEWKRMYLLFCNCTQCAFLSRWIWSSKDDNKVNEMAKELKEWANENKNASILCELSLNEYGL